MQAEKDEIRKNRKQDERARVAYKERDNTDRERTDSENELRRNNDRRNQSGPSRRSSVKSRSSRGSRKSTRIDMAQRILNFMEEGRIAREKKDEFKRTMIVLIEARWGILESEILLQPTSRLSDSHNNLSKNQSREKQNYQTLNTFTGKHDTLLPTGKGGPAHKTNWEATPPCWKN